jgi:sec-independent protein translocase protein TatB
MLNVGPFELLVVLAVALIVVGPERLPELARSVGRVLRQFRDVQDEVRNMVSSGVDDEMRQAASDFKKATGGITRATDVKGAVRRAGQTLREETAAPGKPKPSSARVVDAGEAGGQTAEDAAEAGGPPADRLVQDAAAEQSQPASDAEPETPPHP